MRTRTWIVALSAMVLTLTPLTPSTSVAAAPETADVFDQDAMTVLAPDGARLVRQPNGISVSVTMRAPSPGDYVYPAGVVEGHPEVFTLWAIVFNHPQHCTGPCGPDDVGNPAVGFGSFNAAGHVNAGGVLTLAGRIAVGEPGGGPPGSNPVPLSNPAGAAVHLAVTSHGALDPATLPEEFRRPTGSPFCGCWWMAFFD